jgi:HEAT repeat protein
MHGFTKPIALGAAVLWLAAVLPARAQGDPPPVGGPPGGGLPPVVGPAGGAAGGAGPARRGGGGSAGGSGRVSPNVKSKRQNEPDRSFAWDVWWELNDDRFVSTRAASRVADVHTTDSDALLGSTGKSLVTKATASDIQKDILPAARRAAKDAFVGVRRQAVIAMGKIADSGKRDVFETIKALVADPDWEVRSAACLALGLQGSQEGVPLLVSILKDAPEARKYCGIGEHNFSPRERAFAALGIGLVGVETGLDGEPIQDLLGAARDKKQVHPDVRVFPALSLGVMHAYAAVPDLKKIAFDAAAPEVVRAHAIVALGKLGDKGSVSQLVREGLVDRSAHVQRSSAIALGLLTDPEDRRTVETLAENAKSAADRGVRNFAIIALGQIGSPQAREQLLQLLNRGSQHDRTFAAIALGVHGWKETGIRKELGRVLLNAFTEARSDPDRGALAIALGLVENKQASAPILLALSGGGSPELRGHLATAIGLLGDRAAIPTLQDIIQRTTDGELMMKAAIALGSIGDPGAVKVLVKVFAAAGNNQPALAGATLALGLIGDRSAVGPLISALEATDSGHDYSRAYAAMALGVLGDKREQRAMAVLQENSNYLATTEWLGELLSIY